MTYIGIDYSLVSPAICVLESEEFQDTFFYSLSDHKVQPWDNFRFSLHRPYEIQTERFDNISTWALGIIDEYDSNDVVIGIEDYAMRAQGRVFHIGENTGILKHHLWRRGFQFQTFAPTEVKKYATGKGKAKKPDMVNQFLLDTGVDLKALIQPKRKLGSPTTDIVDAYYVAWLLKSTNEG